MRNILSFFLALLTLFAGCQTVGTSVRVSNDSGFAVSYSSYGDFLYSGNGEAYSNNREGLREFLAKDYSAAHKTFQTTLDTYPTNPDATYYLGLILIFQNKRDAGYAMLSTYQDTNNNRIVKEVKWWANYCRKKTDMTSETIYRTMNKARSEGYQRQQQEDRENMGW